MNTPQANLRSWLQRFVRGTTPVYLMAAVMARLGNFALIPIFVRHIPESDYGDYALGLSYAAALAPILSFGLQANIQRTYFAFKSQEEGLSAALQMSDWVLKAALTLGGIAALAVWLVFPSVGGPFSSRWPLVCLVVASFSSAIAAIPDAIFRARQQAWAAFALQLAQFLFTWVGGFALVVTFSRGVIGALESFALSQAAMALFGIFFTLRNRPKIKVALRFRDAVKTALPLLPHVLSATVLAAIDRWVLKAMAPSVNLGRYTLAGQLVSPVQVVVGAFNEAESPRTGELLRNENGDIDVRKSTKRYAVAFLAASALWVLASPLLMWAAGARFYDSVFYMPFLWLSYGFDALYFAPTNILYFRGRTRTIMFVTMASVAISTVLTLILIPTQAAMGACIARLLTSVIRMVMTQRLARVSK